jgi:predicted nucleic acid-binding protein
VIVVADKTPLNYLIQMQMISLLRDLYGHIYLPNAVAEEVRHPAAPAAVKSWAANFPPWVTVVEAATTTEPDLLSLDRGEREAIVLLDQLRAELLLVDDKAARIVATRRGIRVTGTIGILRDAANGGLADFEEGLSKLLLLGYRVTSDIIAETRAGLS